ncbi:hypothetical protein AB6A40_010975 [Gnathostoma spinigerum]|uniref:Uncharacterized protein n=1 Tax=Gnathostoma spinigerum TaxID=75299 RepID=A0ABD6F261_9BILA
MPSFVKKSYISRRRRRELAKDMVNKREKRRRTAAENSLDESEVPIAEVVMSPAADEKCIQNLLQIPRYYINAVVIIAVMQLFTTLLSVFRLRTGDSSPPLSTHSMYIIKSSVNSDGRLSGMQLYGSKGEQRMSSARDME